LAGLVIAIDRLKGEWLWALHCRSGSCARALSDSIRLRGGGLIEQNSQRGHIATVGRPVTATRGGLRGEQMPAASSPTAVEPESPLANAAGDAAMPPTTSPDRPLPGPVAAQKLAVVECASHWDRAFTLAIRGRF